VEIADEPKDKSEWRHFADNFRMKMAKDLEAMGGEIQMLGEEIFKARARTTATQGFGRPSEVGKRPWKHFFTSSSRGALGRLHLACAHSRAWCKPDR